MLERLDVAQVDHGHAGAEVLLVGLGEGLAVEPDQARAGLLAVLVAGRLGEVLVPGAGRVDQQPLQLGLVDVGNRLAGPDPDHEVQPGQHRLGHPRGVVDAGAVERGAKDVLHLQAHGGGVAVAGDVDEAGHEPAVLVLAQEQPGLAPLLQVQHLGRDVVQLVAVGLEQLVARVGLEHLEQVLAGVAVGGEAGPLQDPGDLLLDDRHPQHRLGVGRGGEQAEEAPLPRDLAGLVEGLDADVVEVGRAVDRGAGVGLGDDQQLVVARLGPRLGGQPAERARARLVVAQQPEPGARHRAQHVVAVLAQQGVLAVAEEGEVVGGQPLQQAVGVGDLLGADAGRRLGGELGGDPVALGLHLGPVLDGVADVGEHSQQRGRDGLMRLVGALTVELHVHPRLDVLAELALAHRVDVEDLLQDAGGVTADDELRVHHEVHGALLARQLGGDRVDEERHVVGDDLDDAVAAGPAVLLHRRGGDAHVGRADRPVGGDLLVRQRGTEQVLGGAGEEVLGGHVAVVAAQEALGRLTPSPVRELCSRVQLLGTGLVKRRRHGLFPHEMVPSGARRCTPRPSLSLEPGPGTPGRADRGRQPAVGKGPVGRVGHLGWDRARPLTPGPRGRHRAGRAAGLRPGRGH